jgi:tetratricopeptide (TPR) repeat protein
MLSSLQAAKLDIEARDLNAQDVRLYGGLISKGVLVSNSVGNALSAGIQNGDVIVGINNHKVEGIFDLEQVLSSIRGMRFVVKVKRPIRSGLIRVQELDFEIESAIDLQIKKALSIDLGTNSRVQVGMYRKQSILLWHANEVLIYDKKRDREHYASLLKVYNIAEHKTYRYRVPATVIQSGILTDDGLLFYLSKGVQKTTIGIVDIEGGSRRMEWSFELPALGERVYSLEFADINGDDIPDLFYSFHNTITCLDGATGNVIWYRDDLKTFFLDKRDPEDADYPMIYVEDFTRDGALEVSAGPLLLNAATGEKVGYLSFDPVKHLGGIVECRQLVGDPIPDVIAKNGLYDGNSGQKVWQPLRSREFFMADLNGDHTPELVYLLSDRKIHVHSIETHRELYSLALEGSQDLALQDFNQDGFADLLVRRETMAFLYQTNIPIHQAVTSRDRGVGYAASLYDFGLKKDKFFVFAKELFEKGDFESCAPLFLRALADTDATLNRTRYVDIIRYLSSAFIKTGNIEGALGLMRKEQGHLAREVLKDFTSEIVAHLLDRNETWQAIDFLEMGEHEDPLLLARCYLAVGRPEVAVKLLTEMETKPTEAQMLLGKAYVLMNKPISARVAIKEYLKYFPTSSEGWRELGLLEASEEKWDEAEEAFSICLDLDPIQGHLSLSSFYLLESPKRNLKQAVAQARKALSIEGSSRTYLQLAEALVESEEYREANRYLNKVTDPGMEFNRYEKLLQRCLYQIQAEDKYEEAEKLLLSPVFKKRNFANAMDLLNEIIDRYPKSSVVSLAHFRLGEIYLDLDHRDEERSLFHFGEVITNQHFLSDKAQVKIGVLKGDLSPDKVHKSNGPVLELETVDPKPSAPAPEPKDEEQIKAKPAPSAEVKPASKPEKKRGFFSRLFNKEEPSRREKVHQKESVGQVPLDTLKVGEEVETPTKKDEEGSTTTDKGSLKEDL